MSLRIAFLGLGVMGAPMATHLARAGFQVGAYNRTAAKAEAWAQGLAEGLAGEACPDPAAAARGAAFIISCVSADADVTAVFEAALPAIAPGAVFIDHSTTSAALARRLAGQAEANGFSFIDAPVSGGQAGAEAGRLSVMAGGPAASVEAARPILAAYAKAVVHCGPAGAGQLTKMANQIAIAGVLQGLAEALHFCERAGLDPDTVLAAISQGAAQSWQMDNRWRTMAQRKFDFGFAVDLMRKDLGLVLDEAQDNGARLDLTQMVDDFYADVQSFGGGRFDTSSLIERLRRLPTNIG